ncbi:hypothetical protein AB9K17_23770, partial [Salmonella enterica subsp. enterica serovar Kentucky]|uniref:hypothetical protein n=1 Tax=Salmonella enterica TaxID=28901 RepID=UPI003F4CAD9E
QPYDEYESVLQLFQFFKNRPEYSDRIWGMIGPNDNPGVANFIAPISARFGLLTVRLNVIGVLLT